MEKRIDNMCVGHTLSKCVAECRHRNGLAHWRIWTNDHLYTNEHTTVCKFALNELSSTLPIVAVVQDHSQITTQAFPSSLPSSTVYIAPLSKLDPVLSCLPFTVDTWTADTCHKHQFLTHAHKDHLVGISQHGRCIICTDITRQLVLLKFPSLKDAEAAAAVEFVVLEPYVQHSFEAVGMPGVTTVNADTNALYICCFAGV